MKKESIIRLVAGTVVLIGLVLSHFVSLQWLWLSAFVSVNLIQSAFTGFCPLEWLLDKRGAKK